MSRTITAAQLKTAGACGEEREKFDALFPSGSVRVTQKLAAQHAGAFEWDWAAEHLLPYPAWAEYREVAARAFAECRKYPAFAECREVADAAWAECREVADAAWAEYLKVAARTFARLYNAEELTA